MNGTDLEERLPTSLWRLADELSAPPTDTALQRVRRRATTLRRRRQARRTAVGTLLVVSVLGVGLWLRADDQDQIQTGDPAEAPGSPARWNSDWEPPVGDPDRIPALTVDAAGLRPVSADDAIDLPYDPFRGYHLQVFRRPDDYAGPRVRLSVTVDPTVSSCGTPSGPGVSQVEVNGHAAWLNHGPESRSICWQGDVQGTGEMSIVARGVTADELVAFARGLRPRANGLGYDATVLPQGIVEDPVDLPPAIPDRARMITFRNDDGFEVRISVVHNAGKAAFEETVLGGEQVVIADRPAFLTGPPWELKWRVTTIDVAYVTINHRDAPPDNDDGSLAPDRATADAVMASIRPIDESEWQALTDGLPPGEP